MPLSVSIEPFNVTVSPGVGIDADGGHPVVPVKRPTVPFAGIYPVKATSLPAFEV